MVEKVLKFENKSQIFFAAWFSLLLNIVSILFQKIARLSIEFFCIADLY